jgi:hypothetical protein
MKDEWLDSSFILHPSSFRDGEARMAWRKWLVRGLVFSTVGGLALVVSVYQGLTNPTVIRQQVIDKLRAQLPGADVSLNAARLTLLGGIVLDDLRLARRDDPERVTFADVPSAVIYHDKEQLLDGKLVIRKLELQHARIHLIRSKDGRWNVMGVCGQPQPDVAIPIVVIRHGTVLVEDFLNSSAPPAVELKNVNVTLLNDPLPQVSFKIAADSDLIGRLNIRGTWQRKSGGLALAVEAPSVPIRPPLVHWLSAYVPKLAEHARQLEGTGWLQAELGYQAGADRPWSHRARFRLAEGKLQHPKVPVPLDQIQASLRCFDGEVRLERCTAQAGPSRLELSGWARFARPASSGANQGIKSLTPGSESFLPEDADFEGDLKIDQLQVDSPLFAPLPKRLQKLNEEYEPNGPIDLTYHVSRLAGQWKKHCRMELKGLTATYWKFKYPLARVTGTLIGEIDPARQVDLLQVDLVGYAGRQPVYIKGSVVGEGPTSGVDVKIWGDDLTIDATLREALPDATRKLAATFHPEGRLNFQAFIRREPGPGHERSGGHEFRNRYLIYFHDARVRYDVFPYPLEQVRGWLDVQPERWDFHDFVGTHLGGAFRARGHSQRVAAGSEHADHLWVEITGRSARLDAELETALTQGGHQELAKAWKTFNPTGRMNFTAQVEHETGKAPEADVTITALGCGLKPQFFAYQLSDVTGTIRYVDRWVYAEKLRARHGNSVLTVDEAKAYLKPQGGCWVDLVYLRAKPVVLDKELVDALPSGLRKVCTTLQVKEPLDLSTKLTIDTAPDGADQPVIFWDGDFSLRDAAVKAGVALTQVTGKVGCRGRYNGHELEGLVGNIDLDQATILGQPFRNIHSHFDVARDTPDILIFSGQKAQLFGGEVYGPPARLEFSSAMRYELNLTASNVRLEEFARHNLGPSAPVSGLAMANLYLTGQGGDLQNLTGRGTIDVPSGRLYNLPTLLDLLKVLGLRLPDGTAFEEAHASFSLSGARARVHRIDLYGNSISLRGHGEVRGTELDLEFFAVWARLTQKMLPPILKEIPPMLSQYLWKIRLRGQPGAIRCTQEPVPILVEPIKEFVQAVAGRRNREARGK